MNTGISDAVLLTVVRELAVFVRELNSKIEELRERVLTLEDKANGFV